MVKINNLISSLINKKSSSSKKNRGDLIRLTSILGIVINLLSGVIKISIGVVANSVAILSDAVHSLTDSLSSAIAFVGLKMSQKSPDQNHPLGYGRLEYISGMAIAIIVLLAGVEFFKTSISRILKPEEINFTTLQLIILILSAAAKVFLSRLNTAVGKTTNSLALKAAGEEAKIDVLVSSITIVSIIISKLTGWMIDGYAGLALSLFILYTGIELIKESVDRIIGTRPDKQLVEDIQTDLLGYNEIKGAYDFIIHSYGPATQLGSVNLEIADTVLVEKAYEIMMQIQKELFQKYHIYFTFGLYSVNTYDKEIISLQKYVKKIVLSNPNTINMHAFHVNKEKKLFVLMLL